MWTTVIKKMNVFINCIFPNEFNSTKVYKIHFKILEVVEVVKNIDNNILLIFNEYMLKYT